MNDEHHNIPEWYIPDETQVIANEHEKEQIEEEGELETPLCPHCGQSYIDKTGDSYIHRMAPKEPGSEVYKPAEICVNGEKRYENGTKHPFEKRGDDHWLSEDRRSWL